MPAGHLVRFGLFEVDLAEGVLIKNGRRIRLQNQPFQILTLLLEHPGETLTREQLRDALWKGDTFVDFDRSLNAAVAKLRQALGDSADHSRFIETQAKLGYRFIAPLKAAQLDVQRASPEPALPTSAPLAQSGSRYRRRFWLTSTALLVGAAIAWTVVWSRRPKSASESTVTQLTFDTGLTIDPAISPDGQWLAYASDRADGHHLNLWIQKLTPGSSGVQLTFGENEARQPSFSPDGARIAFSCAAQRIGSGICAVPSTGGQAVRLTPRGEAPRFSPDGKWISFQIGHNLTSPITGYSMGQCYVIPSAGGEPLEIARDLKLTTNAVWAPDSEHLLVYRFSANLALRDWYLASRRGGLSRRTDLFDAFKKNGLSIRSNRMPQLSQWQNNYLLFSATRGDGVNTWRMPVTNEAVAIGNAERLTLGTAIETSPIMSANGDLFFESLEQLHDVRSFPLNADRAEVRGELQPLTAGPFDVLPSISADGRFLAFASARGKNVSSQNTQIHVRDIETNREVTLSDDSADETHPHISSDGSLLSADQQAPNGRNGISGTRVVRINDRFSRTILGTANSWGFSHDNGRLLITKDDKVIRCLDIRSGKEVFQFAHPVHDLYQASFAPGDRFIAVESVAAPAYQDSRIFIIPIKDNAPAPFPDWVAIDHSSAWDDKPRWAPSGNVLYFLSDRDGRFCLWAQRLHPESKQPIGKPFAIWHFHGSRMDVRNVGLGFLEIGIARDRAVFGVGEVRGNIWSIGRRP